jgi:Uma2 family endonuclease
VLSPDDRPADVRGKVDDYLTRGVPLVLVVDPEERTVTVFRRLIAPVLLGTDDELDLSDVVSGFRCPVREIVGVRL